MRIAHITDVHVLVPPTLSQLFNKRLVGTANLYLLGRRAHFDPAVQRALVDAVAAEAPDALLCTGDLTAQATPQEFEAARDLLAPLFSRQPTALIPGNHDTYTRSSVREGRMEALFSPWMGEGPWPRLHLLGDAAAAVALQVCRPRLDSAGVVDPEQMERLPERLSDPSLRGRFVFLMLHYPLRGRRGEPYGPATRDLKGARQLEELLLRHTDRVGAIVHGHEHRGFRATLPGSAIPILNPGSSGYAWLPGDRRTAHFNLYTLSGGALSVERLFYSGEEGRFLPEVGGAYASGG